MVFCLQGHSFVFLCLPNLRGVDFSADSTHLRGAQALSDRETQEALEISCERLSQVSRSTFEYNDSDRSFSHPGQRIQCRPSLGCQACSASIIGESDPWWLSRTFPAAERTLYPIHCVHEQLQCM